MGKYDKLWTYVAEQCADDITLSFAQIETILGFPIDHSFLQYKKELLNYGYELKKISIKEHTVRIIKRG